MKGQRRRGKGGERKRVGYEQFSVRLPYIEEVHHVRVVDEFHDDDLPLYP